MRRAASIAGTLGAVALLVGCGGDDDVALPADKASTAACTRPSASEDLNVRQRFAVGDSRRLTITRDDNFAGTKVTSTSKAVVRVVKRSGDGFEMSYESLGEPVFEGTPKDDDAITALQKVMAGVKVRYTVDADGVYQGVSNLASVREQALRNLEAKALPGSERLRVFLQQDIVLQTTAIPDVPILHNGYGTRIRDGAAQEIDYPLPNPFGGDDVPGTGRVTLTAARDDNGCAGLRIGVRPEAGAMKKVIAEAPPEIRRGLDAGDVPDLDLSLTMRFAYDRGTTWMSRAVLEQDVRSAGVRRLRRTVVDVSRD